MARVLVDGVWFEQVEPNTFSEQEFEDRVLLHAPSIYPEYFVFPFKKTVSSEFGDAKPDLVFVSRDYEEWRIVEVELGHHSFAQHVEPQIQKLADADYSDVGRYMKQREGEIDLVRVEQLLLNREPEILLIVNQPVPSWESSIRFYNAVIATFELFLSDDNREIFRVDGEYPTQLIKHISECDFHPHIPRLIEVKSHVELNLGPGGYIRLRLNNCITTWQRLDAEGRVFLQPTSRNPLKPKRQYEILRQGDSSLVIREREGKAR